MAHDMFLKLDGVKGESKDHQYKDQIDILSWSWGMSQSGSMHAGGGGGSGKVDVQDIHITKYVDTSSPNLMAYCCSGKHFPQALLTVRKAGGDAPVEYVKIKIEEVLVTSVSTGGSGSDDRIIENVTLGFAKVVHEYTPQAADGSAGASIPSGWDVAANKTYDASTG
ncbi:MAG: type VI secretion system tube protein Hcp [Kiloniellales bacterium]|nr:type VI secretion system tube protein Hcp [Kiloniellales bacterium]